MAFLPNRAHDIPFCLINATNGAALTGASVTGYRVLDGGAQASVSGSITELGLGQYLFEGSAADFAAGESVGLLFTAANAVPAHLMLQMKGFHRSTAYDVPFLLVNTNDGSALMGAAPTGRRCLDGGVQAAVTGTFVERGNGQYVFQGAAADFSATDVVGLLFSAANALPVHLAIDLVRVFLESDTLEDSPASVLQTYVVSLGHMTTPSGGSSWPLYVSNLPDGDNVEDDAGCVYDTTPIKDGRTMDGKVIQHYGVQLTIRSVDYDDGWDKINDISAALDAVSQTTVTKNATDYLVENITRAGGVNSLGQEPGTTKRRYLFTANYLMTMRSI